MVDLRLTVATISLLLAIPFVSAAQTYIPIQKSIGDSLSYVSMEGENKETELELHSPGGFGDYDGDGHKEILDGYNLVDKDGEKEADVRDVSLYGHHMTYGMGDLDGDKLSEIIYLSDSGNLVNLEDSKIGGLGPEPSSFGGITDFDKDGKAEIAFKTKSKKLAFVDGDGNVRKTGITIGEIGGAGDIDGDGSPEVAVNKFEKKSGDIISINLTFIDFNGNIDRPQNFFPQHIGDINDFDNDGGNELAYINYDDFTSREPTLRIYDTKTGVKDTGINAEEISVDSIAVENLSQLPSYKDNDNNGDGQKNSTQTENFKEINNSDSELSSQEKVKNLDKNSELVKLVLPILVIVGIGFVLYTSYVPEEGDPLYKYLGDRDKQ